jgi:hypothetical protein
MPNTPKQYICLLLICSLTLSSCATTGRAELVLKSRETISSVNVAVGEFAPGTLLPPKSIINKNMAKGAVIGAAPGGVLAGVAASSSVCSTPWTASICALFLGMFGLIAVVGGTAGAVHGSSVETTKDQAQTAINDAIKQAELQNSFAKEVVSYGVKNANRDIEFTAKDSSAVPAADASLDVAITKVDGVEIQAGFWGIVSTHYAVSMQARARFKRSSDGVVIADRTYRYVSVPRTPDEWSINQGENLIVEIGNGYQQLAEWIADDYLLTYKESNTLATTRKSSESGGLVSKVNTKPTEYQPSAMPLPIYPPINICKPVLISGIPILPIQLLDLLAVIGQAAFKNTCDKSTPYITLASLTPSATNSLRPTFRWSFDINALNNHEHKVNLDSATSSQLSNTIEPSASYPSDLHYELRVFQAEEVSSLNKGKKKELRAIKIVYEKNGIVEPSHTLEQDLAPCSNYLWTVRAIFEVNGITQATEWAGNYWNAFAGNFDPSELRQVMHTENIMLMRGKPMDYTFPFSTGCGDKTMVGTGEEINITQSIPDSQGQLIKNPMADSSSPASTVITDNISTVPIQKVAPIPLVKGVLLGKELKVDGIAGLSKTIELKLLFKNVTEKDIIKIKGEMKLFDDAGQKIGVVPFHSERRIKSNGEIRTSEYIFPVLFSWYPTLKKLDQEKIHAEFTFDLIQFDESIKLKFFD